MRTIIFYLFYGCCILSSCVAQKTTTLEDMRIRDPYILADSTSQTYYLYGSTFNRLMDKDSIKGVEVFTSKDLINWNAPKTVYRHAKDHWGKRMVWAPEVHQYKGKYYLFVTFTGDPMGPAPEGKPEQYQRGTQILAADRPEGPFTAFTNGPTTPEDWMSLDGTLWVEDGKPYMVFCHEWAQITDGTMELVPLKKDLSAMDGKPKTLFKASDAQWVKSMKEVKVLKNGKHGYVTDGCFVYRTKTGKLLMIWSSFGEQGYAIAQLISETGKVTGPWKHLDQLIFEKNGGHGMLFTTFEGKLMIALHQPNGRPNERPKLFELEDMGDYLQIKNQD